MIAFTICARNFLAQAHVLFDTFSTFHPDVPFHVVIADSTAGIDLDSLPFSVLALDELGIPDLEGMANRYNITEFNTAMKPFAFLTLLDRHPGQSVVYIDPDILVVSRFTELLDLLDEQAECVLTPHLTEPAEYGEFRDELTLQYGIYNLGFCAMSDSEEVRRTLWWWSRRALFDCRIDFARGLFVDQKWADLFPAFISKTAILRHPGYNVAYWNLQQRLVRRVHDMWLANDVPLRFVHFSGADINNTNILSSHSNQFKPAALRDLGALLTEYRECVARRGYDYFSSFQYAFGWNGEGGVNVHTPEPLSRPGRSGVGKVMPYLPVEKWWARAAFEAGRDSRAVVREARRGVELASIPAGEDVFQLPGYCVVCESPGEFVVSYMYAEPDLVDGMRIPNWREHLACTNCGLVSRTRAAYHLLLQEVSPSPTDDLYVTEAVTPLFRSIRRRFPAAIGSEYFGASAGGDAHDVRHEDVQALTFADGSLDVIVSLDVLEHVADENTALREFARCLRTGGRLLMTVPFDIGWPETLVRATMDAHGVISHLLPPEFHGNPVDSAGSLAFRKFGWSILQSFEAAGFSSAEIVTYWSDQLKYFGDPGVAFIATK